MSSLYKNGDTYYIADLLRERVTRSLATKDYNIRKLKPHMELKVLKELHGFELKQNEVHLVNMKLYMVFDHDWAEISY